jgi:hypothetical protein
MDKTQVFQLRTSSPKLVFLAYYHMEIHIATATADPFCNEKNKFIRGVTSLVMNN